MLAFIGSQQPLFQSSYDLFMSFVRVRADNTVDVTDVLSTACWHAWLSSRQNKVKHADKSFYRVFVSQIRATDTRKPFPEEVERELLKLLRQPGNIWDQVFPGNPSRIGRQGFRHYGYHEEQRIDYDEGMPKVKLRKTRTKKSELNNETSLMVPAPLTYENDVMICFCKNQMLEYSVGETSTSKLRSVWDTFKEVYETVPLSRVGIQGIEKVARTVNYEMFPPALIYLFKQDFPEHDNRYQLQLSRPTIRFNDSLPIGRISFKTALNNIQDSNTEARDILGENLEEKAWWGLTASKMEIWLGLIRTVQEMYERNETWKLSSLRKKNGNIGLFLCQQRSPPTLDFTEIHFQEVSHLYPEYLRIPFFI